MNAAASTVCCTYYQSWFDVCYAVARSLEAKELKVGLDQRYFQIRDLNRTNGLIVFESHYKPYADRSYRVMFVISEPDGIFASVNVREVWARVRR
jgi:hypothetical protein